jgi:hypothetical protein
MQLSSALVFFRSRVVTGAMVVAVVAATGAIEHLLRAVVDMVVASMGVVCLTAPVLTCSRDTLDCII